jgi:hypothetical protein
LSFLTDEEVAALKIRRMILHVVGGEGDFQPQDEMQSSEHSAFFIERILDAAIDGLHSFADVSTTRDSIEIIAKDGNAFVSTSQLLSKAFSDFHVESSRDGAFFIFELDSGVAGTLL